MDQPNLIVTHVLLVVLENSILNLEPANVWLGTWNINRIA